MKEQIDVAQLTDRIAAGYGALDRGAWRDARAEFEAALAGQQSAEALEGLSRALWWLDDVPAVLEVREQAYRLYRERGDARGAARLALRLAEDAIVFRAEEAVANGWTERARRLLAELEPCPEHALLAAREAFTAFLIVGDTETAGRRAADAIAVSRELGLLDVEMLALAIEGASLVAEGDLVEGMRRLDEATVVATGGEMRDIELVGQTCCFMIHGCERVRDFDRAAQWCGRVQAFCREFGLDSLLGVCRAHYAMVLIVRGDWDAAEAELAGSREQLAQRPGQAADAVARLGELRRRQGRLDEAAQLFDRVSFHREAQIGLAALALDRDDPAGAAEWGERFLRATPVADRTRRAHGFELISRARAAAGKLEAADAAAREVESLAEEVGTGLLTASAAMARGVVETVGGSPERARGSLEDAVDIYGRNRLPYETAEARLELAAALARSKRWEQAGREARLALEAFERLGAGLARQRAARRLREIEGKVARRPGVAAAGVTSREAEVLALVAQGLSDKEIAARLVISEHTARRHVRNILTKLDVPSRAAAAVHAAKAGLV
jgi:LuxR family transcriptional regulator, maltose regulon positive regulatory protein